MKWIQTCPMKKKDTSETPQAPVRLASHWLAVLRRALTLCALGAPSDPLRFARLPLMCAPVRTAWARGARDGLSLSLRARSLPVAFRASDVVVHVQGAHAESPEQPLSCHPRDTLQSVQALIREFGLWTSFDRPFRYCTFFRWRFSPTKCLCTNSLCFSITLLTSCDIFLVPLSRKEERQRIRRKLCRVYKDFFRRVQSRDKSKQLLKSCQELQWHRDTSIFSIAQKRTGWQKEPSEE